MAVQSPGCGGVPGCAPLCGEVLVGAGLVRDGAPGMEVTWSGSIVPEGGAAATPRMLTLRRIAGVRSDSIAVDWLGRNLYWTDGAAGRVLAASLKAAWRGIPEYTVVMDEDLDQPHSLVLQPLAG